jgi:hypothetical protein
MRQMIQAVFVTAMMVSVVAAQTAPGPIAVDPKASRQMQVDPPVNTPLGKLCTLPLRARDFSSCKAPSPGRICRIGDARCVDLAKTPGRVTPV